MWLKGLPAWNESAITGESAPVIRGERGDRSAVTGGTRVISDRIVIRGHIGKRARFLDRMIAMVEGAKRKKNADEIALTILTGGTDVHLPAGVRHAQAVWDLFRSGLPGPRVDCAAGVFIPTTIGGLLSAIGISGLTD